MAIPPALDPRRCGVVSAPRKTTTVPRIASARMRRTLTAALDRADGAKADRLLRRLNGELPQVDP